MIRQWAITASLGALLLFLLWNFIDKVVFYDPFEEMGLSTKQMEATEKEKSGYKWAWGKDIAAKNLFSENRSSKPPRPDPAEAISLTATPPEPVEQAPNVTLSGIIKNPDGSLTAYIQVGNNPVTGVRLGDSIDDVRVDEIEERRVKLIWRQTPIELKLKSSPLIKKR